MTSTPQRPQKWVIVLPWMIMGGAERQALYLASGLASRGINVVVVGLRSRGSVSDACERLGIECIHHDVLHATGRLTKLLWFIRLVRLLRSLRPDVLMPFCMPANVAVGLCWRLTGARVCVWQQRDEGRMRVSRLGERLAVLSTPRFITNSSHGGAFLREQLKIPRQRISLVLNGVAPSTPSGPPGLWRSRHGVPAEQPIIAMVANLHHYKDHMTLLHAWRILTGKSEVHGWCLVLAGQHYDMTQTIKQFIAENGLSDSVMLPGSISDVPDLLQDASFIVHSSLNEGVPNGVLEAMAAGRAVVATDIAGIREAVGDSTPEQLCLPSDPSDLAVKMLELIRHPDKRTRLGRSNQCRVAAVFGVDRMVDETIAVAQYK